MGGPLQTPPGTGGAGVFGSAPPTFGPAPGTFPVDMFQQAAQPSFQETRTAILNGINNPTPRPDIVLGPQHQVAVLDEFYPRMTGFGMGMSVDMPTHGAAVSDVVRQQTGLREDQIARVSDTPLGGAMNNSLALLTAPGPQPASERLNSYLEAAAATGLAGTNSSLEAILNQNAPNLRGVNFSTGMSALTGFTALRTVALQTDAEGRPTSLTPMGRTIFEGLGLSPEVNPANLRAFAERGMERIGQVHSESPVVRGQLDRHEQLSRRLEERGIHYTVSAGNDGGVIDMYRGAGVRVSDRADDNLYSNQHNVTVGSLDTRGTADPSDDTVAAHTSGDPRIAFLAPGVNRQVTVHGQQQTVSGTSFASPHLMSSLFNLSRENPGLPNQAIRDLLHNSAGTVQGSNVSAVR